MFFENRKDAGEKLSRVLQKYKNEDTVILGIPRGGVVLAAEVAKNLGTPFDVIIPRKIGAPHNPEVAIGAVTQDGTVIKDEAMVQLLGISDNQIEILANKVAGEISRRVNAYRGGRPGLELAGKTVIVVDDGIATGFTVQAALKSVRNMDPRRLVLAVPVMPADTVRLLRDKVDELVYLHAPELFYAVGQFYMEFDQVSDQEVIELLSDQSG
ncbi:MAG: phosphoribosyltransferase [Firmicutes bacterium HGW-Firmicutes-8]|nr:MAG: phosphoribosyltransferase [Firmicutes bacterium HGW-Firmicutes-8]